MSDHVNRVAVHRAQFCYSSLIIAQFSGARFALDEIYVAGCDNDEIRLARCAVRFCGHRSMEVRVSVSTTIPDDFCMQRRLLLASITHAIIDFICGLDPLPLPHDVFVELCGCHPHIQSSLRNRNPPDHSDTSPFVATDRTHRVRMRDRNGVCSLSQALRVSLDMVDAIIVLVALSPSMIASSY